MIIITITSMIMIIIINTRTKFSFTDQHCGQTRSFCSVLQTVKIEWKWWYISGRGHCDQPRPYPSRLITMVPTRSNPRLTLSILFLFLRRVFIRPYILANASSLWSRRAYSQLENCATRKPTKYSWSSKYRNVLVSTILRLPPLDKEVQNRSLERRKLCKGNILCTSSVCYIHCSVLFQFKMMFKMDCQTPPQPMHCPDWLYILLKMMWRDKLTRAPLHCIQDTLGAR